MITTEVITYDKNGNLINIKHSKGLMRKCKYTDNNKILYFKDAKDIESWYKYDKYDNETKITEEEYKKIEFEENKKYTKFTRFEIMEI